MKYILRYEPKQDFFIKYLSEIEDIVLNGFSINEMTEKALVVCEKYKNLLLADDESFVLNTKVGFDKEAILKEKEQYVNLLLKKGMQKYHLEK